MIITITKYNIDEIASNNLSILYFSAPWCGPCNSFSKIFNNVSEKNLDIIFGKINTDEEKELSTKFNIKSLPTVILMKDGIKKTVKVGLMNEIMLTNLIKDNK